MLGCIENETPQKQLGVEIIWTFSTITGVNGPILDVSSKLSGEIRLSQNNVNLILFDF